VVISVVCGLLHSLSLGCHGWWSDLSIGVTPHCLMTQWKSHSWTYVCVGLFGYNTSTLLIQWVPNECALSGAVIYLRLCISFNTHAQEPSSLMWDMLGFILYQGFYGVPCLRFLANVQLFTYVVARTHSPHILCGRFEYILFTSHDPW